MDGKKLPDGALGHVMTVGHFCCDMNQAMVPALLPFLVVQRGIDYTSAAGLMFASSFLSSLIQPLLGVIADRKQRPWLMSAGVLITGLGIAAIGFLTNYWAVFAAIMTSGFGSAVFHPEGGRMANCVAGEKKGRGMSNFIVGGSFGYVVGPMVAAFCVSLMGLRGTAVVLVPTLAVSAALFLLKSRFQRISDANKREVKESLASSGQKDDWPAFLRFSVSIFSRSIMHTGLTTFIPLYWVSVLLQTQEFGSLMVTVMALAGTISTFIGGRLADRYGFRRVIRLALAVMFPMIIFMLMTNNVWLAMMFIMLCTGASNLAHSPSIVLGQKYLPNHLGLASGVTMGLVLSMGGIFSPLLGRIGDNHGLTTVLYVIAGIALFTFLASLLLKKPASDGA